MIMETSGFSAPATGPIQPDGCGMRQKYQSLTAMISLMFITAERKYTNPIN
jgi:hypothetical protein